MPRLCFISHRIDSIDREGPHQHAVRWLIPELVSRGIEVDVLAMKVLSSNGDPRSELSPARVWDLGKDHVRLAIPAFRSYLARERPDVCIGLVAGLSIFALLGRSGMSKQPAVVPWEATPLLYDLHTLRAVERVTYPPLMRQLYPRAATVFGVSNDCIATLADLGVKIDRVPRAVVPNPMNADEVERLSHLAAPALPIGDWGGVVVAAGRLDRQKGHDVLLQAVAEVRASGFDLGVVILGEGHEREVLETLVRRLGLSDRALLPGRIAAPHRVYRLATIFVHPSRWEGFGMSLLEAMAVGAPVIATSCPGGPKEILDGRRYGLLVPPDDPTALATAVASLMGDEALRSDLGAKARLRAKAYAPRNVADRMIQALTPYLT